MHDINAIKADPQAFDAALARRGRPPASAVILDLDMTRRTLVTAIQTEKSAQNRLSAEIGAAFREKRTEEAHKLQQQARDGQANSPIPGFEAALAPVEAELERVLLSLPNLPASDVPDGVDETSNRVVAPVDISTAPRFLGDGFTAREHDELGVGLGMMDFDAAANLSGSRYTILKGDLARLSRALGAFMLDVHTREHGFLEVDTPVIARAPALLGTGQLPKFADDLFKIAGSDPEAYLIPTAEVTLTNLAADTIDETIRRYVALTPCFRAEAGSAGRDTRGMLRQHQFMKCELVVIAPPHEAAVEHDWMLECAARILEKLELPHRIVSLCTGDLGFSARKTYDLEVWLPGQQAFREISSVSNCGDFQARRMGAKYRTDAGTAYMHTLNGSGVAVGRALIAVMENYQTPDGNIIVPEVLRPFMGKNVITRA
jgi:seryl-tRNA synthetase